MSWYRLPVEISDRNDTQDGWMTDLGDVQRYSFDPYQVRVYITKLTERDEVTVSATLHHVWSGGIVFQEFWRYKETELSKAKKGYEKVCKICEAVIEEFRTGQTPNNLIQPHLREELRYIHIENKPTTRIPHVDWARQQPGVQDWRNSIYGNRYPKTDGF